MCSQSTITIITNIDYKTTTTQILSICLLTATLLKTNLYTGFKLSNDS